VESNVTLKIFEVRRENAANLPAILSLPLVYNFNSITVNTNVDIGSTPVSVEDLRNGFYAAKGS
jgi:hypothetical protein